MLRLGSPSIYLQRKRAPYAHKCHIGNFSAGSFILEHHPLMMQIPFTDKGTPRGVFPFMDSLGSSQILLILFSSILSSVQYSSVAQLCPTLRDPMNRSTPGFPVHHQLPEFTQTHIHQVSDAIQTSHPLSSPSPPAPNPSQHQSLFQ